MRVVVCEGGCSLLGRERSRIRCGHGEWRSLGSNQGTTLGDCHNKRTQKRLVAQSEETRVTCNTQSKTVFQS